MALSINSTANSASITNNLSNKTAQVKKSYEKLSSGKEINRASDNPANLAVALDLLTNARSSSVAARNISDGVSVANIADGSLSSASDITGRLQELAAQSANGTLNDDQRKALNDEYQALKAELDRTAQTTEFNGQQLLNGDTSITIQAGTDGSSNSQVSISLPGVSSSSLGLSNDISTQQNAQGALDQAKSATQTIASARGDIGASVSRLESAYENVKTSELNSRTAASSITDLDVAKESSNLAASRISQQAATAVQAQANNQASLVLKLLS